ncbi:MAG: SDR family NAD(P)-dependent oxidoreductase [Gammaproteobacteria bacterium]|nr:SDR family NAD(P)-dependent oxidoreductase [Gammaproteobacteria bacterium]
MRDVAGKTAFITGGASGIGLAMARSFSVAGMKVVIADVEQAALDALDNEFEASNAEFLTIKVDVTDRDGLEAAAAATEARFGKVHLVCNNAGVAVGGRIDEMTYDDWDWVLGVNINGVVNGISTFVERLKSHGEGGHFVNTASMAGHVSIPGLSVYTASKFAVVGISETMRADLMPHNIGVSVLCPGMVDTNILDSGRNRPDHFVHGARAWGESLPAEERDAFNENIRASMIDPAIVGDMVLHAIQTDEFYIFTHPGIEPMTQLRGTEIADAFARWRDYCEARNI